MDGSCRDGYGFREEDDDEVGLGMVGRGLRWEKKSLERMRFAELV